MSSEIPKFHETFIPILDVLKSGEIINFNERFDYSNHNFFCSHGLNDHVIPIEIGRETDRWFSEKNINHKYLEFESAHGINSENFEQMNLWLLKN